MFEQVEEHGNHAGEGLETGLAVVKQHMELHGSDVSAWRDGLGLRSVFTPELPSEAAIAS
jgi:signal transduction histidine kinase